MYEGRTRGEAAFKVVIFGKDIVAKQFSEKVIVEDIKKQRCKK